MTISKMKKRTFSPRPSALLRRDKDLAAMAARFGQHRRAGQAGWQRFVTA
ncbi:hypothetical protein [Sphingomonas profundi]|nr:hypothetical protein [Sphingomonas profundi]